VGKYLQVFQRMMLPKFSRVSSSQQTANAEMA